MFRGIIPRYCLIFKENNTCICMEVVMTTSSERKDRSEHCEKVKLLFENENECARVWNYLMDLMLLLLKFNSVKFGKMRDEESNLKEFDPKKQLSREREFKFPIFGHSQSSSIPS